MRFGILGPLQVADDEGHEVVLAAPKQRALLAILLLHANEVVSRDQMVEELWAGEPPAKPGSTDPLGRKRLRPAVRSADRLLTAPGAFLAGPGMGGAVP